MRNLKRALSLALAAIMLIGMMVVSASAAGFDDFSDKDEIVNKDAVSMLTILGVINGKEDGSFFDPAGNVTRAEMAKMIATVLNQGADVDGLYVGMNTGLTDVKGHWAESYINYCYSLGIIAGRGNGKFDPAATVTGNEAAKMLLVAAGYDAQLEGLTGNDWAIKTASLASTLGIFDDLTAPTGDPLTRDNAALLIYNALDIEMIQKYENGYAIAFEDHRTLLSTKYGVYKVEGVVTGNEWAQLEDTDSEDALATGKTKMDHVKVYKSTTSNTVVGEYEEEKNPVIFNVSTPVDMLGQTVTMYVRKTTVLANSEVLGVYVNGNNNVVKTTADTQDTMKDFLKGTGLSVDGDTAYYVNYGVMKDEAAATKAMGFESGDRFNSVKGKTNGYGVELTAIDNDNDGEVEYVLYLQETLSQVIAKSDSKETTTLNTFNSNKAIDNEDIVTEADLAEGDLVLTVSYGGRYYVSEPQVITGQMESYTANKEKEQTITVGGTEYHPSYIQYKADTADNTYEFDVLKCDNGGVEFDSDYDFILDSNGNVIAYRPSEQGLYDYALVLDSGYEPGAFASDASGKIKVLLADGTEGIYTLNFSASAKNVGEQIADDLTVAGGHTETYSKNQGIQELKGFLGTSDSDNSATAPWKTPVEAGNTGAFVNKNIDATGTADINDADYKDGRAAGYVIAYSLNDDNVLTIKSIVGSNHEDAAVTYNPADVKSTLSHDYKTGSARIRYASSQVTVDKNTVAFYYDEVVQADLNPGGDYVGSSYKAGDVIYGVAVGYDKMTDVPQGENFLAKNLSAKSGTLASTVLFDYEGVTLEKDYAFVLSRSNVDSKYATLNVVLMDGTVSTLKVTRDDYNSIFAGDPDAFGIPYAYTTDGNGVSELTDPGFTSATDNEGVLPVVRGYARQLRNGTVALYTDKTMTTLVRGAYGDGTFTYEGNIWNVEDVDNSYEKAPVGSFSENVGREVVMVIDTDKNIVRAAYILSTLDGVYAGQISVAAAAETGVNTNSTKLATATVTKPAGGTGALTYEWFKCDDAAGSNPVSLKNDANYTVSSSGVTSVLNVKAGVLTAGDHYFKVVATYTETGKVATTADDVVKVTVAAAPAAGSLSISNTDLATPTVMKNGTPVTVAAGTSLYLGFSEGDKVQIVSSDIKANSYWKVAGTVYQASGAGILSFTMPKTDLTIAKADQQVKYILGEGVSLTGTDYDATTGYAPVGTQVTITVAPANGTGVLVSNDGKLKSAAVGTTVGKAIATASTFTPTNTESDVYMNAAAKVTTTGVDVKLGSSAGSVVSANDYVLVGEKVFVEATANGTLGDVILADTYTADGEDKKTSSGDGTTKASIIYTMTNADVAFSTGADNPKP
ncbi:S-layer homology domain-containing protein [Flavonifractor plautii]|uniref:S-layer homology domain-containing protein n=1 Tax=Flavonifractor plautii TaxID=292800 RepID=UPI003DA28EE1